MTSSVNWIAAYNRLFILLDRSNTGLTDLMPLCKVVKDDISKKLQAQGPFPV